MPRQKLTDPTERKQSRTVSLTLNEIADFEQFGAGSLSKGMLAVLKRHSELLHQLTTLENELKKLKR